MSAWESWQLSERAGRAQAVLALIFLILGGAFFKAQVVDGAQFRLASEGSRLRPIPLPAPRGEIFDRNGLLIAENVPGYSIRLLATSEDSLRSVLDRLRAFVPADSVNVEKVVRRWTATKYEPVLVFASGEFGIVSTLEEHRAAIPGLVIQAEPSRRYPDSTAVAHLVGYVSEVSERELESGNFPNARQGEVVGKNGLEVEYDSILRGRQWIRYVEVTAKGRTIRDRGVSGSIRPQPGASIKTTIDLPLQRFVDSMWRAALPGKNGALLAMTPQGEILAYISFPSYDPNDFVGGIDAPTYSLLANDPNRPLFDRVIQATYPPASPWKLATAAMGLRRGLVTMDTRMRTPCTGGFQFGNRNFRCWKRDGGHGSLTLSQAIATSCDVYFYQLGLMLDRDPLLDDGASMGFGERSGVDLEREKAAGFPTVKSYIRKSGGTSWSKGELLNLAIGQGRNVQTLVGMTSFYAALATDGVRRAPFMVRRRTAAKTWDLGLKPDQLQGLRSALAAVVDMGTAAASGGRELKVAGKTGTGQFPPQKDLGWFIGYAPADAPKIVVGIVVEEGLHGSSVAGYVVNAIGKFLGQPVAGARILVTEDTTTVVGDSTPRAPLATPRDTGRRGTRP
ncbi:MAG: penicillin-binding protein 2 [Gemmatimonadetes bacterium]|nr:penicillin-binding protein 2 [Gemmatimonadota bacterium]